MQNKEQGRRNKEHETKNNGLGVCTLTYIYDDTHTYMTTLIHI